MNSLSRNIIKIFQNYEGIDYTKCLLNSKYLLVKSQFLVEPNIRSVITKKSYVELRIKTNKNKKSYVDKY